MIEIEGKGEEATKFIVLVALVARTLRDSKTSEHVT